MVVRIPKMQAQCEYMGTIYVQHIGDRLDYSVKDLYDQAGRQYAAEVDGCRLMRNISTAIPLDDLIGPEANR